MNSIVKRASILVGGVTAMAATAGAYVFVRGVGKRPAFFVATHATSSDLPPKAVSVTSVAPANPIPMETKSADPNPKPGIFGAAKEVFNAFLNDDVMTQAAALAFYTGLAIAPILTVAAWAARIFLPANQKWDVAKAFSDVMGKQAYEPIKDLLGPTSQQAELGMTAAGLVSLALVAFSASGVFGQVQSALNVIWHVQARPSNGVIGFVKKRLVSLGMLASILFLLLLSLVVSVTLVGEQKTSGTTVGNIVGQVVSVAGTVAVFTVLFAAMFKFVPDAKIGWKPVWVGGFFSAVLFAVGKFGLAFYLGKGSYETSYGAAIGSFVALLVWVYYSAVILLVGAEATQVYARRVGHQVEPDEHAVRVITTTDPA